MENLGMFMIGLCVALAYSIIVLPSKNGDSPKISLTIEPILYNGMLIIPISEDQALHLHHWIVYACFLPFVNFIPVAFWTFCLILTVQGLFYDDAFKIFVKNPWKKS